MAIYYCVKCDGVSYASNCETCGTRAEIVMTEKQCKNFSSACWWIRDKHVKENIGHQPMKVGMYVYLSYINFMDFSCRNGATFQRADEYTKLARENIVHSVTPEQAAQNLNDFIKWRLSVCGLENIEYTDEKDPPMFPKTKPEVKACLKLVALENCEFVKSYLTSLL